MTNETLILNEHNKQECPPMHRDEFDISPTNSHTIVHIIDAL